MTHAQARGLRGAAGGGEPSAAPSLLRPRKPPLSPRVRARLTLLLVLKSAAEALFVLALVAFYFADLRAGYAGAVESVDGGVLKGWVVDRAKPSETVEVQLYVDGRFAASTYAGETPGDSERGGEGVRRRFSFDLKFDGGAGHEARVYAVREGRGGRRVLSLLGRPVRFGAGAAG